MNAQRRPNPLQLMPGWSLGVACAIVLLTFTSVRASAGLDPVFSSYDAIPGRPLVIAVRPDRGSRPPSAVTLRFPDGREVEGEVAAIRLTPPPPGPVRWLGRGPTWTVVTPRTARAETDSLAWFVLVDLPDGVIGQEIWLDGRPIALRWLPRPELLAARFGFEDDADDPNASALTNPWASPLPESWRERPDLLAELEPAFADPTRRWRAVLATTGLHAGTDERVGPITPELLRSGLVEASARVAPIERRLLDAIDETQQARWRVALARVWSADPALSMRLRHALAGAAEFRAGRLGGETIVAPAWAADAANAQILRDDLLDAATPAEQHRAAAESWLARQKQAAIWVLDDAVTPTPATIGAMWLAAGDAGLFPLGHGETTGRPDLLVTRRMSILRRAPIDESDRAGRSAAGMNRSAPAASVSFRLNGEIWRLPVLNAPAEASPPGVEIGPWHADRTMAAWLDADAKPRPVRTITGMLSRRSGATADGPGWVLFFRIRDTDRPDDAELRIWIGPRTRPAAVITAGVGGRLEIQQFEPDQASTNRTGLGRPTLVGAEVKAGDGGGLIELEITLPEGAIGADGVLHLGAEYENADGARVAWPHAMMPWETEPARRAIDTTAWLGRLAP